jgi:hypothetical protein
LVLQPFADRLGIKLIGTELEAVDGLLTGRMTGNNCRCENKVLRLEAVYGPLASTGLKHGVTPAVISSCWPRRKKHTGDTFTPHGAVFACGQIEAGIWV